MDIAVQTTTTRSTADEAMRRYAAGEDVAFGQLYAAVTPCLTRLFRQMLRDRSQIPDLIQETFLRVHRARARFLPGAAALPWIQTIARRLVVDTYRLPRREESMDPEGLDRLPGRAPADGAPTAEQLLVAKRAAIRLARAFDSLPEGQRAAFRLVKSEGLSMAEAAAALGTTVLGTRLRTHKACKGLRAALEEPRPSARSPKVSRPWGPAPRRVHHPRAQRCARASVPERFTGRPRRDHRTARAVRQEPTRSATDVNRRGLVVPPASG